MPVDPVPHLWCALDAIDLVIRLTHVTRRSVPIVLQATMNCPVAPSAYMADTKVADEPAPLIYHQAFLAVVATPLVPIPLPVPTDIEFKLEPQLRVQL